MLITLTHHAIGGHTPLAVNVDHIVSAGRRKNVSTRPPEPEQWYNVLVRSDGKDFIISECPAEVAALANGDLDAARFARRHRPEPGSSGRAQDAPKEGE